MDIKERKEESKVEKKKGRKKHKHPGYIGQRKRERGKKSYVISKGWLDLTHIVIFQLRQ